MRERRETRRFSQSTWSFNRAFAAILAGMHPQEIGCRPGELVLARNLRCRLLRKLDKNEWHGASHPIISGWGNDGLCSF